jgi:hypothetical protein
VPHTSPYLDNLIDRWMQKGADLRKEAAFQKDLIEPLALAAHGNRLAMRERRRRDLRQLEESYLETRARWEERLQRVQEWKNTVRTLSEEDVRLRQLIQSSFWLQKARRYQDAFIRRLEHRADLLQADHQGLQPKLDAWLDLLQTQEASLNDVKQKAEQAKQPFYVSRARKQPEEDFVWAQNSTQESLGLELRALRRSLNEARGRLQKAFQAIERQTPGVDVLFEMHMQELLGALKGAQKQLDQRRDEILSDALTYEACRNLLRRLQDVVKGLRCIEDIPKRRKRGWLS